MSLLNDIVNGQTHGWDSILGSDDQRKRQLDDSLNIAALYKATFSTDEGRKVLAILVSQTIFRPIVTPTATKFDAGIREGRADLVRAILRQIELANNGGQETLQPWQKLTPPMPEPVQKPQQPKKSQSKKA